MSKGSFSISETESFQKKLEGRDFRHLRKKITDYEHIPKLLLSFGMKKAALEQAPNLLRLRSIPHGISQAATPRVSQSRFWDRLYVYPVLRLNPFFGNNIKKLKGEFEGVYRYRIGDYRLFYTVEEDRLVVVSVDIEKRRDAYR